MKNVKSLCTLTVVLFAFLTLPFFFSGTNSLLPNSQSDVFLTQTLTDAEHVECAKKKADESRRVMTVRDKPRKLERRLLTISPSLVCQGLKKQQVVCQHACEFPLVCDSFPPSMLIRSVFVCVHDSKRVRSVCNLCSSM